MARPRSTYIGQVFGRLTIVSEAGKVANGTVLWNCQCTCGNTKHIRSSDLNSGRVNSCGCLLSEVSSARAKEIFKTHGMTASPTYIAWHNLKARCTNPNDAHYHRYGGRGIGFDPNWTSFEAFLADMGENLMICHWIERTIMEIIAQVIVDGFLQQSNPPTSLHPCVCCLKANNIHCKL